MTARCATLRRYAVRVLARTAVLVVLSVVASWRRGAAQTATWIASPPGPTVGDTIWVERAIVVPAGWQVRAGKLDATEAVEPLADPAVLRRAGGWVVRYAVVAWKPGVQDRKSTRLNSSHGYISYAVFCLKKKKHHRAQRSEPCTPPLDVLWAGRIVAGAVG